MKEQYPNILSVVIVLTRFANQMHCAMQDEKYLYFLMDLLPGGELMNLLESKATLPECWIQFYAASVSH